MNKYYGDQNRKYGRTGNESTAGVFADYSYENEKKGVLYLFPNREAVKIYMRGFVQASLKCGCTLPATDGKNHICMI